VLWLLGALEGEKLPFGQRNRVVWPLAKNVSPQLVCVCSHIFQKRIMPMSMFAVLPSNPAVLLRTVGFINQSGRISLAYPINRKSE
jgi:hypothetical protein